MDATDYLHFILIFCFQSSTFLIFIPSFLKSSFFVSFHPPLTVSIFYCLFTFFFLHLHVLFQSSLPNFFSRFCLFPYFSHLFQSIIVTIIYWLLPCFPLFIYFLPACLILFSVSLSTSFTFLNLFFVSFLPSSSVHFYILLSLFNVFLFITSFSYFFRSNLPNFVFLFCLNSFFLFYSLFQSILLNYFSHLLFLRVFIFFSFCLSSPDVFHPTDLISFSAFFFKLPPYSF